MNTIAKIQEQVSAIPSVSFLIYRREPESINIVKSIEDLVRSKDSESREILNEVKKWAEDLLEISLESTEDFIEVLKDFIFIAFATNIPGSKELKRKILERLGILKIKKSRMYDLINEAIRTGKLYYIYDVEALSDIVKYEISRLYSKVCGKSDQTYCENLFFRFDSKELLRHFTHIFTLNKLDSVYEELRKMVETYKIELEKTRSYVGISENDILVIAYLAGENSKQKTLIYQGEIYLSIEKHVHLLVQVNYYDIDLNVFKEQEKIKELFKLNVEAILYKALTDFVETLIM